MKKKFASPGGSVRPGTQMQRLDHRKPSGSVASFKNKDLVKDQRDTHSATCDHRKPRGSVARFQRLSM